MTGKLLQQGTNAERSRLRNRQAVLGQIHRAGTMGRAEIARSLSLTTQAVSNIIAELHSDGLLIEQGRRSAGRGLPAVQYGVNPEGGFAIGIEVRPDAVLAALLDMQGQPVLTRRESIPDARPETVLTQIEAFREIALTKAPAARMLGAGVVMPGPFGNTGISGLGTDLPGWQNIDSTTVFREALRMPVEVSNDANAAAMAERITGAARGLDTYAYLYFGTGIGLGVVSDGRLVRGAFGNAGEIGHIPMAGLGDTLENLLSRLSVQRHMRVAGKTADQVADLDRLVDQNDPDLALWLNTATQALGQAMTIIENLFDPQTVILGGAMPDCILDHLAAQTPLPDLSVSHRPDPLHARLMRGASGRMTATLGAAALVLDKAMVLHPNPTLAATA